MKIRWLVMTVVLFVLWGCDVPSEPETIPATEQPEGTVVMTEPTVPSGLYTPGHTLEQASSGALRVFPLDQQNIWGIRFLGDDLLVFSGFHHTQLTLLSGDDRYISAQRKLGCAVFPDSPSVVTALDWITYYDEKDHALVTLDKTLTETCKVFLPGWITGTMALSSDCEQLYYCTENAVRIFEPETGIDRPLAQMSFAEQSLVNLHCDGTVLECRITDSRGHSFTRFLSAETGLMLYETDLDLTLWTDADFYFALRYEDFWPELLSGSVDSLPTSLITDQPASGIIPIAEQHSLILVPEFDSGPALIMDYYDLESGIRTARLQLPVPLYPMNAQGDTAGNIWFHCFYPDRQTEILCCWNPAKSETRESESHQYPLYSAENPDHQGLEQCRQKAAILSETHDVRILIWTDATAFEPWDYTLVPEHRVPVISYHLEQLDEILSRYPEGFLKEAASQTGSKKLNLCLVRSIQGNPNAGALDRSGGLQFWDSSGDAYAAVITGPDLEQNLYHELFHIAESRIFSASTALDNWSQLNPPDFEYDYDYFLNNSQNRWELTQGENPAFIDCYSMSFPKEDRARIMEFAMMPEQRYLFASAALQKKLHTLCLGIREAFNLEDYPSALPWEQHLEIPLK